MGKHRLDKSRAFQVEVKESCYGQWREWVRTPGGSGSGQSLPFNSLHNAIMYGIYSVREDVNMYGGMYGPQYYIKIIRHKRKVVTARTEAWANHIREMAYDGEYYGNIHRT